MPVSEKTYRQVALEDPEGNWELHCGRLVGKPGMTAEHNEVALALLFQLRDQLDPSQYHLRINMGRVRRSAENYYVPMSTLSPPSWRELNGVHGSSSSMMHRSL
jgi:hypothetical protein